MSEGNDMRFIAARRWLQEARRGEVRGAAGAALVAVIVAAWLLAPVRADRDNVRATAPDSGSAVGEAATGGPEASGAEPGGVEGGGAETAAGGSAGGPGTSVAAGRGNPGTTGGAGPSAGGQEAGSPGAAPEDLVASDQGVTANTVKIGVAMFDLGSTAQVAGSVPGFRDDIPRVVDALVKHANDTGGVHGRRIEAVKRRVDLISGDDQQAKCIQFTEQDRVFAVVDTFNFLFPQTRACVSVQHKVPLVTHEPGTLAELFRAAPYQISSSTSENRIGELWVAAAKADGFFDPAKGFRKLGLYTDNCDRTAIDDAQTGLKAWLRRAGVTSWAEYTVTCDYNTMGSTGPQAALALRQAEVSHVMFATLGLATQSFLKAAQAQQYDFRYYVSDFRGQTSDGVTRDYDPDQFDRVRGVTAWRMGETTSGKPLSPKAQECSRILVGAGLAAVTNYIWDAEALMLCDNIDILVKAARAAPRNLKRPDIGAAAQRLPEFEASWDFPVRFGPQVFAGGGRTFWARVEWRRECRCFHQVAGPERIPFP